MATWLYIILAFGAGMLFGVFVLGLCIAAGDSDRWLYEQQKERER